MMARHLSARIALAGRRGAETWGWGFLLLCLVAMGAYTMYPELFHGFVQWVLNGIFDALNQSFDSDQTSPAGGPHPDNLTTIPKDAPAP